MENKYLAIRDRDVVGSYPTFDEAKVALHQVISHDKLVIFFKKRLLKLFFKGKYNPNNHLYYIAVVNYNETNFQLSI